MIHFLGKMTGIIVLIFLLAPSSGKAQVVNEATKKRISIGVGLFTDIWMNMPDGIKTRTINQGVNVFATYNVPFGKSNFSFAIGLGLRVHNLYGNFQVKGYNDSIQFAKIPDSVDYQRSKVVLPYLELPIEFRFKTKYKFAMGIGFKIGYMLPAHTKWVGEDYLFNTTDKLRVSFRDIKYLEKFSYGPTLRVGYKWFHVNAYYSLSNIFSKNKGPEIAPVSIGFLLMPF
jgi:hypothetical protein